MAVEKLSLKIHIFFAILGLFAGVLGFMVFVFGFYNYHAGSWSLVAGFMAAFLLHIHHLKYRECLGAFYTKERLKFTGLLGLFMTLVSASDSKQDWVRKLMKMIYQRGQEVFRDPKTIYRKLANTTRVTPFIQNIAKWFVILVWKCILMKESLKFARNAIWFTIVDENVKEMPGNPITNLNVNTWKTCPLRWM